MNNYANYIYSNNENEGFGRRIATNTISRFLKRKELPIQKAIATRRAATVPAILARKKAANVAIQKARAEQAYNIGTTPQIIPLNQELVQELFETDPNVASIMVSSHEENVQSKKQKAVENYAQGLLGAFRTETNEVAADWIKQIPSFPRHVRPTFIILARLDDLYGKLTRNVSIANTNAERRRLAGKKYDVNELRRKVRKIMDAQSMDRTVPFPGHLLAEVDAVFAGEDVASVLAPNLPAAARINAAFTNYNTRKNVRYQELKTQMNTGNSSARDKIIYLSALEEILEIIRAQPVQTNEQQETIDTKIAAIEDLKSKVETAIAGNTPIEAMIKAKIIGEILGYDLNDKNTTYAKLKKNKNTFNKRNLENYHQKYYLQNQTIPTLKPEFVGPNGRSLLAEPYLGPRMEETLQPQAPTLSQNNMRAARLRALAKGGRKTRKARKNRKN